MLNAKGVLLHTTYNLLKASFWLVCSLEQGNITKRSGIQTKTRSKVNKNLNLSKNLSKKLHQKKFVKKFINEIRQIICQKFV